MMGMEVAKDAVGIVESLNLIAKVVRDQAFSGVYVKVQRVAVDPKGCEHRSGTNVE